jgi:nucleoside-diphosphate-sugar epimerase
MILLIGQGYIGSAFAAELAARDLSFMRATRPMCADFRDLWFFLRENKVKLVINAAGATGVPNVDWCNFNRSETLLSNLVLPVRIADACAATKIPLLHLSSGCLYDGKAPSPEGFRETDSPNFTFDQGRHSFYSASKALAERAISAHPDCWTCRIRMPFCEVPHPRNLLSRLLTYRKIFDSPPNSLSHLGECVRAALDLWTDDAPYGVFNLVQPGSVTNREIIELIRSILKPEREFEFFESDAVFYAHASAPRSNCVLSPAKAIAAGAELRDVREMLTSSLEHWQNRSSVGS